MSQDAGFKDAKTLCPATLSKLKTQPALANACLTDDTNNTTFTPDRIFEFENKGGKLTRPTSKRAEAPSAAKHAA